MEIKSIAELAVSALEDKKGTDIKVLNLEGISVLADYFIIATGNNVNQLRAMADEVNDKLSKEGINTKQIEGYDQANWILMDYKDIIIHLFLPEAREYYNLERIWRDAKTEM